jgi:phosphate transport system substrate-binding protein
MTRSKLTDCTLALGVAVLMVGSLFAGCITPDQDGTNLKQTGSSTVLPLAERWADDFDNASVSVSGGGSSKGLNSLLLGEADLGDASRKIAASDYTDANCQVSEAEIKEAQSGPHPWQYPECNGITPTEWPVAYDALPVVVNPANDWVEDGLTYEQLRQIFTTENTAETWSEVEGLEDAPDEEIQIFAPDDASGTYTYFFEEIAGSEEKSLLADGSGRYSPSANDNSILNAIANTEHAIGFFGLAYYVEHKDKIDAVPIQGPDSNSSVEPSFETAGHYPITRPIHAYTDGIPSGDTAKSEAVRDYLHYALSEEGQASAPNVGYLKVSDFAPETHRSMLDALK